MSKKIIISMFLNLLAINSVFAESWWWQDLKWYEWVALAWYYLIINPITWIFISIIVLFIIYKILKKKNK